MRHDPGRGGFTIIELLIVLSVIALLMGMLMPAINVIRSSAMKANTENLLRKVDTALQGFHVDARSFPYAPGPVDPPGPWGNELGYHLGHDLESAENAALNSDLSRARAAYLPGGGACITDVDIDQQRNWVQQTGGLFNPGERGQLAAAANRMGSERAVVGIMAGNLTIAGTQRNGGAPWKDRPAALITAQSRGWAGDYLKGALEKREVRLDADGIPSAIVDRYKREIVYVNPVIRGVNGFIHQNVNQGLLSPTWFGFHARVRTMVQVLDSDIRTTAARAHVSDYELWSAGRDGKFHAQRNHPHNRDNISIVRYTKELQ